MNNEAYILEVRALEWAFIISKFMREHKATPDDVRVSFENGHTVFAINKSFATAEELAAILGTTPEQLMNAPKVLLLPLADDSDLPKPTVPYIGEA